MPNLENNKKSVRWVYFLIFSLGLSHSVKPQNIDTQKIETVIWEFKRPDGIIEKGKFQQGKRNGIWTYYDSEGNLVLKEKYKAGQRRWAFFYRHQKIIATVDRHGIYRKRPDCGC